MLLREWNVTEVLVENKNILDNEHGGIVGCYLMFFDKYGNCILPFLEEEDAKSNIAEFKYYIKNGAEYLKIYNAKNEIYNAVYEVELMKVEHGKFDDYELVLSSERTVIKAFKSEMVR